jgi:hypothetical protein
MKKIEISEETLRGLYLIMCGLPYDHSGSEVYEKAIPIMNEAHKEILKLGEQENFDCRGGDLI